MKKILILSLCFMTTLALPRIAHANGAEVVAKILKAAETAGAVGQSGRLLRAQVGVETLKALDSFRYERLEPSSRAELIKKIMANLARTDVAKMWALSETEKVELANDVLHDVHFLKIPAEKALERFAVKRLVRAANAREGAIVHGSLQPQPVMKKLAAALEQRGVKASFFLNLEIGAPKGYPSYAKVMAYPRSEVQLQILAEEFARAGVQIEAFQGFEQYLQKLNRVTAKVETTDAKLAQAKLELGIVDKSAGAIGGAMASRTAAPPVVKISK